MHEMSIALAVVEQVADAARSGAGETAEAVTLQVGELAGVVPDALHFCFSLACAGTVLDGADLHIEPVTARARCGPCAREWDTGMPPQLCCPGCGGATAEMVAGRELQIKSVRWADGPECARPPALEER